MRTQVSGIQSTALVLRVGSLTSSLSIPGKLVKKANSQALLTLKLLGRAVVCVSSSTPRASDAHQLKTADLSDVCVTALTDLRPMVGCSSCDIPSLIPLSKP